MANQTNTRASRHKKRAIFKPKSPNNRNKRDIGAILFKVFIGLFLTGCIALLLGGGLFLFYAKDTPELSDTELEATPSSRLFSANNEVFQEIGIERRELISATEIPKQLEDAIISVEDRRFYNHIGVDPVRIVGSALANLLHGGKQGGSTLTQQLIKLSYFSTSTEDQNLRRKSQEAVLAVQLEREKSKQEILTYYINKVYMSNGVYGMETAAQIFFGKPLSELSLSQTALIAGLPNAPNYYDPYVNPEAAKERRDVVLMTMLDNGKISQAEHDEAVAAPIDEDLQELTKEESDWKFYDAYIKETIAEIEEKTGKDVYRDGLDIYTNIDIDAQKRLYNIVNTDEYVKYPDDKMQVASTLIEAETGKVVAQIGGRNFEEGTMLGRNLAINTSRDFGSTVKPIVDYAPAFEYLKYETGKITADEPYKYVGTDIEINNWDKRYMGIMTLRRALVLSRNVPAAKLFMEVGVDNINEFLGKLDIHYKKIDQSNAISSNTNVQEGTKYGVSSLKMAAAYAAFANGGTYHKPQYVNKVVYQDGSEETEAFETEGTKAMEDTTAYMITDILKGVINDHDGTGTNAKISGLYQAGKTGTSNYSDDDLKKLDDDLKSPSPDSSFVGYTRHYSMAVWTGYENHMTPVTSESSKVASDVYRELMQFVSSSVKNEDWEMPEGLVRLGLELHLRDTSDAQTPVTPAPVPTTPKVSEPDPTSSSQAPVPSSETPASSEEPKTSSSKPSASSDETPSSGSTEPPSTSDSTPEPDPTPPVSSSEPAVEPPASSSTPVVEPPASSSTPVVEPPASSSTPVVEPPASSSTPVVEPPASSSTPVVEPPTVEPETDPESAE